MEKDKNLGTPMKAEDVLNALEELSEEEFEKFKWYLLQPESLPGLPTIKRSSLERTKSLDIVDLMVHTYTLQRCMEVTGKILEKINRNDLLQRLLCSYNLENWMPKNDDELQQMIKSREMKIEKIKDLVKISKDNADREKAKGVHFFTSLKESAERRLKELIKEIEDKQKTTEKEAEDFIRDLEQDISERSSEVNVDPSFSSLRDPPSTKNRTEVRVHPPTYDGMVERAVAQLKETLLEDMKKQLDLKRIQQFAVDVTLDLKTAHRKLILSDDGKQVKHGDSWKNLPDNPERFSSCVNVLGEQSFSSGRFYFEVQVKGKTDWDLGVAGESVNRKEIIDLRPQDGFWTLVLRNGKEYSACEESLTSLHLHPGPEKVGVFVDYEEGLVSFYDADSADLIYSFTDCCFNQKLYPYFSPFLNQGGKNSAPLIICPVNQAA